MNLASSMHDIALRSQDDRSITRNEKLLYNYFLDKIRDEAEQGNLYWESLSKKRDINDISLYLFQKDFKTVKNLLQNDGFVIDCNVYDPMAIDFYLTIRW